MKNVVPVFVAAWLGLSSLAGADDLLRGMTVEDSGAFQMGGVGFGILHFGKGWTGHKMQRHGAVTPDAGYPRRDASSWKLKGTFSGAGTFDLEESLEKKDADAIACALRMTSAQGVDTEAVAFAITLPLTTFYLSKIHFDDKTVALPAEYGSMSLYAAANVKKIAIPTMAGVIEVEGDFQVNVQDERAFAGNDVTIRLMMNPATGLLTETMFNAVIRLKKYRTLPLDIAAQANMGFQDDVDGDRKGGWTDQGTNDLRMMKPGRQTLGAVDFTIVDPAANGGRSCLAFAGPEREYFLKTADVAAGGAVFTSLYLLHALAWTGENASAYVGLFLSRYPVENKPIEKITLAGAGNAVWMVVGIAGGDEVPFLIEQPYYIVANREWRPITHQILAKAGSALDLSFLNDAPAGKYGDVVMKDGHFEFADRPGTPVRFHGANLCFSANYQDQKACDFLADQLVRLGYNTVRLHHYDDSALPPQGGDSTTLDPGRMDQLDYLFNACKQRGLYISIDLYTFRQTRQGEFPELENGARMRLEKYKAHAAVSDALFENWKGFARNLLTHVNPYTGLAWKDDPALFNISLINEGNLNAFWRHARPQMEKAFAEWMEKRNLAEPAAGDERNALFNRFLVDLQIELTGKCAAFVRSLGTKAFLSDVNMQNFIPLGLVRDTLEYVDNHTYWDHPRFVEKAWSLPFSYSCKSATAEFAAVPRELMSARLFGKPYAVTEWNYCSPNPYRGEGGPLMGAYAALQDWDVLHRFAYSHASPNTQAPSKVGGFDIVTDPLALLTERMVGFLFLRGDVTPGKTEIPFVFSDNCLTDASAFSWDEGRPPKEFTDLGLMTKLGAVNLSGGRTLPKNYPCAVGEEDFAAAVLSGKPYFKPGDDLFDRLAESGIIRKDMYDGSAAAGRFTSDTGEITIDTAKGTFRVVTPKSECLVMPAATTGSGSVLHAVNQGGFATVSVHSLDGKPLAASARMVLFHLTDVRNNKMRFKDKKLTIMDQWGDLPHLVRVGQAEISLGNANGALKVWALDMTGERVKEMTAVKKDGTLSFVADTGQPEGAFLAYEIAVE
jgi:hypothetical protein